MPPSRSFAAPKLDPWDGVLLVDKPPGFTSHDVVAKVRNFFRLKKVGHGGTLDPMATGLLILLLGRGTRASNQVMGSDKIYEGVMRLGITTDTQDAEGEVLEEKSADGITDEQVLAEMRKRIGDQMQIPPMVSAIKKNGVPLYKLARKGEVIEREARLIHVYNFNMLGREGVDVSFNLKCTKGTYVRTLVQDLGQKLGCGAHLTELRRSISGKFDVANALSLDQTLALSTAELEKRVIPMLKLAANLTAAAK